MRARSASVAAALRRALMLALVLAALGASTAALAQADGDGEDGYRRLIVLALEEFDAGRWAEARALFRRAHALEPNARTLRGIAMTSFELREYAAAIDAIDAALASADRPLTEAQRAHVLDLRGRADAFVARYELDVTPQPARVSVDGVPVEADGPITVNLGEHTLRVVADGHRPWERRVRVVGGERERLRVALVPSEPLDDSTAPPTAPPPALASDGTARDDTARDDTGRDDTGRDDTGRDDTAAHGLLVGAGVALVASGAALGYWVTREIALGQCDARVCDNTDTLRTERDVGMGLTLGSIALTAGLAVAGVVLLTVGSEDPAQARITCGPRGLGLACAGHF